MVLVLHGGSADSAVATTWRDLAVLRLRPVARTVARQVAGTAVYRLRFSVRGWNGDGAAALRDARWALANLRSAHPGTPIVVLGHSMGGRVAALLGGDAEVVGIVLLAPWVPSGDPAEHLAGVHVVMVQGGRDRTIPLATTQPWISHAEHTGTHLHRTVLPWGEHTMVLRFRVWHRLAADGVATVLTEAGVIGAPRQPHPDRPGY